MTSTIIPTLIHWHLVDTDVMTWTIISTLIYCHLVNSLKHSYLDTLTARKFCYLGCAVIRNQLKRPLFLIKPRQMYGLAEWCREIVWCQWWRVTVINIDGEMEETPSWRLWHAVKPCCMWYWHVGSIIANSSCLECIITRALEVMSPCPQLELHFISHATFPIIIGAFLQFESHSFTVGY